MTDQNTESAKSIFMAALDLDPAERPAFIAAQCKGDAALQREVEALLAAHEGKPILDAVTASAAQKLAPTDSSPLSETAGTRIGHFKLLQQIGEGGFGVVFMADQEQPVRRRVALKIIKLGMDTRRVVARFEAERQALAMMDHPHIARVLDAGATDSGRPYFVMELVKGDPITDYCDRNNLSISERLELFTQVCNAVQHAHTKGVIHRDIKPSNVLVHTQDGHPHAKVIDFGIAKATDHRLTEKTLFTEHKALIGTPAYMSPEQAEGSMDIDTRTDVYSLGVLMYELLTGTTPFDNTQLRAAVFAEMQRIIRETEPPKPSTRLSQSSETLASIAARRRIEPKKLGVLVRGELDWIVMKALDKDRARRYETANALAADVGRHLTGEPVVAAPPSVGYRVRKFVRKHRGQVIAAGVIGAMLVVSTISVTVAWRVTSNSLAEQTLAREEAVAERRRADDERDAAKLNAYAAKLGAAQQAMAFKAWPEARSILDAIDTEMRGWEWRFLHQKANAIWFEFPGAKCAEFSPDGKFVLTASNDTARLWDAVTGQPVGEPMRQKGYVTSAEFSPDGKLILTGSNDGFARLWDAATGHPVGEPMRHEGSVTSAQFSPDDKLILTTSFDGIARLWNLTGKQLGEPIMHEGRVDSATFSPDGKTILAITSKGPVLLWDAMTHKPVGREMSHDNQVQSALFSPNGKLILTVTGSGEIRLWDAATGQPVGETILHGISADSAAFSPDGKLIMTVSGYGAARLWNVATGKSIAESRIPILENETSASAASSPFSPDGQLTMLRSLGYMSDESAHYVHSASHFSVPERRLTGENVDLEVAAIMENPPLDPGAAAHAGGQNRKAVKVLSPDGSREVAVSSNRSVRFLVKSHDQPFATGGDSGQSSRRVELAAIRLDRQPTGLAFSPDGTRLVVWLEDQSALVWDTRGPESQQADRDARAGERKPAEECVDAIMGGTTPFDQHSSTIRADKSLTPLRRLVALEELRDRIAAINDTIEREFGKVTAECLTPAQARAWVQHLEPLPGGSTPLARRIREGLEKKIANWKPDAASLNTGVWTIVLDPASPSDRIAAALEAASMALGLNPNSATSLKNLGAAQYRAGHYEEALKNLTKAMESFGKDGELFPNTLSFIAMCQIQLGRNTDAQVTLDRLKETLKQHNGEIRGKITDQRLDMEFSEFVDSEFVDNEPESWRKSGVGQFELLEKGTMFTGKWRMNNLEEWKQWSGRRRAGDDPEQFDGLWMTSGGDMWLFTEGDKLRGVYGFGPLVREALVLAFGQTASASSELEQWATLVIDFSSEYGSVGWGTVQALGYPNTGNYGDISTAWAPKEANGGIQFLTLGVKQPVCATGVVVRETNCNGFVTQVDVLDVHDKLHTVWSGTDSSRMGTPVDFFVAFSQTQFLVKGVKIYVDTNHDDDFEEIDAVCLIGTPECEVRESVAPGQPIDSQSVPSPTTQPSSK